MADRLVKIKNLTDAAKHLGKDIAKRRQIPLRELKNYISVKEIKSLIQQYAHKSDEGDLMMNFTILNKICQEVEWWVSGIELCKMASNDLLDVYWDEEKNCMTFASKE